jgi:thiamine kinase-like enzyme
VEDLDRVLELLEGSLGTRESDALPLHGGITNRNFRVRFGGSDYVVRLPGRDTALLGIDRRCERLANEAAARLGIAPPVAAAADDYLVTRFIACQTLAEREPAQRAGEIALMLRRFHESGVMLPVIFAVDRVLDSYAAIVRTRGAEPPAAFAGAASVAARIVAALPPAPSCPCHDDLLAANIISAEDGGRLMMVDWEYAGMGDPRFDLGNLAVNNGFEDADEERLLAAYYGCVPSDSQRACLKLMRVLSDAREAAWGMVQRVLSTLEFDFDGYATEHFERLQAAVAGPQFEEWLAAASG